MNILKLLRFFINFNLLFFWFWPCLISPSRTHFRPLLLSLALSKNLTQPPFYQKRRGCVKKKKLKKERFESCTSAHAWLHERTSVPIIPVHCEPLPDERYRLVFHPKINATVGMTHQEIAQACCFEPHVQRIRRPGSGCTSTGATAPQSRTGPIRSMQTFSDRSKICFSRMKRSNQKQKAATLMKRDGSLLL